jgi:murein DD-endopeptidase MepM/ murein hydrolase activator NlpD
MNQLQLDARLSRRRFQASLLTGLVGLAAAGNLPAVAATATESACSVTPEQMMQAAIGSGGRLLAQYLASSYMGYSKAVHVDRRGSVYVRHTGRDFGKPAGSEVRALTSGRVVALLGKASEPTSLATVVADGGGRYWVYGHMSPRLRVGQVVNRGQVVGTIANPRGAFSPHVHITTFTVRFPSGESAVRQAMGWGRAYGKTQAEAVANAQRYTEDPLLAYAKSLGKAC